MSFGEEAVFFPQFGGSHHNSTSFHITTYSKDKYSVALLDLKTLTLDLILICLISFFLFIGFFLIS